MLAPPRPPAHDDLEALIREARERQRRRRVLLAAVVAVAAAAGVSAWAAIPGGRPLRHPGSGGSRAAIGNRNELGRGRVPIVELGSSGGVTWAINGFGMWLTTNGGHSWRPSAPAHVRDMGDLMARVQQVEFLNRRDGWLLAVDVRGGPHPSWRRHAELDWTNDGGRTWHSTIPKGCCGDVSFVIPRRGVFIGRSKLFSTKDGGRSWTPVARTPFAFGVPAFVDARHGVAVVGKGLLFRTSDGGRRWTSVRIPSRDSVLPNVAAFGERLVVPAEVVGPPATRLVVYTSEDGGSSWSARPAPRWWRPFVNGEDGQMFSAASATVWFATGWRKLAVTRDAGRSWRLVRMADLPPRWTISAISFTTAKIGWAVFQSYTPPAAPDSPASVLMRTTDGGVHWTPAGPRVPEHHSP